MGKVLSLFRKEPSSEEKLIKLEEKIKDLESYTVSTRETQRKFAGRFLVASIGTYVIAFVIFYFYFFPPTWRDRLIYSLPLLLFPVLIILLKYCVSWYFNSKIDRNNCLLIQLRNEKRQVLQNVMDKETYKVALEILNTFGDKSMRLKASQDLDSSAAFNASQMNSSAVASQLQHRTPVRAPNNQSNRIGTPSAPMQAVALNTINRSTPAPIGFRPGFQQAGTPQILSRPTATAGVPPLQFPAKTPFPVIDTRKQNVMEKMMDFIISDGPSNRFAMICTGCCGHNGMALQEDFEYVAFKCAFCGTLNPSRKIRPKARGLSPARKPHQLMVTGKAVNMSSSSSEDEEAVVKNRPLIAPHPVKEDDLDSESLESADESESLGKKAEGDTEHNNNKSEDAVVLPKDLEEKKKD